MLTEGSFPEVLKIKKIIPIHKKGIKEKSENYRLIALVTFENICERIIALRIEKFLQYTKQTDVFQYGFLKKNSTDAAAIDYMDNLSSRVDNGKLTVSVFIDFSKAFDTVNHERLLSKLEAMGVRGACGGLLRSYLRNRKQYVSIDNCVSGTLNAVPQNC